MQWAYRLLKEKLENFKKKLLIATVPAKAKLMLRIITTPSCVQLHYESWGVHFDRSSLFPFLPSYLVCLCSFLLFPHPLHSAENQESSVSAFNMSDRSQNTTSRFEALTPRKTPFVALKFTKCSFKIKKWILTTIITMVASKNWQGPMQN